MKAKLRKIFEWGKLVIKGFLDNNCSMHAAGLTYFSMLAIVPVLCVLLFFAKTLGADDYARTEINSRIDEMIANVESGQDDGLAQVVAANNEEELKRRKIAAEEFAATARDISNKLFERIEAFDIGTLGWIGFGFLLWTVISSIGMVEVSFNEIFEIEKPRPLWRRSFLYLFTSIILPILVAFVMSVPALNIVKQVVVAVAGVNELTRIAGDGVVAFLDSKLLRILFTLASASLSFAYVFAAIPNCRIRFRHALYGGAITAVLFGCWMKVCAVAQVGIAKSSALYGSFAVLPIVLAWMYMSWQIVLLGANMVHAFQKTGGGK